MKLEDRFTSYLERSHAPNTQIDSLLITKYSDTGNL